MAQTDKFLIFQRNEQILKIPPIHAPFMRVSHHTAPAVIDPATLHVIRSPTCWKTEDNNDPFAIEMFNQLFPVTARIMEDPYPGTDGKPATPARRASYRDYLPFRSFPVQLPGKPGAKTIRVRTLLAFCGPAYYYELRFIDGNKAEALRLHLGHSGDLDWYLAMDGALGAPPRVVNGVPVSNLIDLDDAQLTWCEVRWEFPATLLPPGAYTVRISYHHLPGAPIRYWGKHQRLSYIQRMALEYLDP